MWSTCTACKNKFLNTNVTPWCDKCNTEMNESWEGHKNLLNSEEIIGEKNQKNFTQTPFGELINLQNKKPVEKNERKKSMQNPEQTTTQIKNLETSSESNGDVQTENVNAPSAISTTTPTVQNTKSAELVETLVSDSQETSQLFVKEISHSIKSLNGLESELFDSIKGLKTTKQETALTLYDPHRIEVTIACGHQIISGMKMKMELLKMARGVS